MCGSELIGLYVSPSVQPASKPVTLALGRLDQSHRCVT
jgi:hypothetical protein